MMMSRRALTLISRRNGGLRYLATDAAPAASTGVKLNFSLPYEKIYDGVTVHSVILPGAAGEYGVTANHVPYVAQLKPGVFQIFAEETTQEPEKYFVCGGYALTHEDSSTVGDCVLELQYRIRLLEGRMLTLLYSLFYYLGRGLPRGRQIGRH